MTEVEFPSWGTPGERAVVRRLVRALVQEGYELSVDNGGESLEIPPTRSIPEVMAALGATDAEHLLARMPGRPGWKMVFLVYGNDPSGEEVIADYSASLESAVASAEGR